MEFIQKVKNTIDKYSMIEKGDKVIIGCSGGIDSMVLLDCLLKLKDYYDVEIAVAHLNHMIRDEAEKDQLFVKDYCIKNNISFYSKKVDVLALKLKLSQSIEEAGRNARYSFFYELKDRFGFDKILLGHNKNDLVETFFLNLFRGSGSEGLLSIPPKRDFICRPLIEVTRKEIEEYARENNVVFVEDRTNFINEYGRNKIRNILIPFIIENFNPSIIETIASTVEIIKQEEEWVSKYIDYIYQKLVKKEGLYYVIEPDLKKEHEFIAKRIIKKVLKEFGIIPTKKNIEDILNLFNLQSGSRFSIRHVIIEKQINQLILYSRNDLKESSYYFEIDLNELSYINKKVFESENYKFIISKKPIEYDIILKAPSNIDRIVLRNRKNGDYIIINGIKKKLKDLFNDYKIPKRIKDNIPLISYKDQVVAILFNLQKNSRAIISDSFKKYSTGYQEIYMKIEYKLKGAENGEST